MIKNIFNIPPAGQPEVTPSADIVAPGGFAAILARAGVGKTALLVQIAINSMLRGKNVLHISTADPVDKVGLWYREMFQRLNQEHTALEINKNRDQLLRHRFIMTFETESFSIAKLKKRVDELISQDIFTPALIIIDDFSFDAVSEEDLADLKAFVEHNGLAFWFTIRTHRDEPAGDMKIPTRLAPMARWFDLIFRLEPDNDRIYVRQIFTGENAGDNADILFLDPSTLLIRDMAG
ncbi:MAG: AAA family ATPase [Desulfosalsimonadaceae bacterium]